MTSSEMGVRRFLKDSVQIWGTNRRGRRSGVKVEIGERLCVEGANRRFRANEREDDLDIEAVDA